MPNRQALRHLQFGLTGLHHASRHEVDHLLHVPLAHGGYLFGEQPIQQRQRSQQGVRCRLGRHFKHKGMPFVLALAASTGLGVYGKNITLQHQGFGFAHDEHYFCSD